jgi:hypothetical protein
VYNYRPISVTQIISKVFERLIAIRFSSYLEKEHLLPPCQFVYRKGLGTCDALLTVSHHLQAALDRGQEARLVQLDFSAAFDMVSHVGLLYKLRSIGLSGSMLSMVGQFLRGRRQPVVVDGSYSEFVNVESGMLQGCVLGQLLFVVYTADLFLVVQNHLVNYADDSTLSAVVRSPADRPYVAASLNVDLACSSEWCWVWNMKLNPAKTKTFTISRSRTNLPLHGELLLGGSVLDVSQSLVVLGVTLDSKLTFEAHIRKVVSSSSRALGIMRKASKIF